MEVRIRTVSKRQRHSLLAKHIIFKNPGLAGYTLKQIEKIEVRNQFLIWHPADYSFLFIKAKYVFTMAAEAIIYKRGTLASGLLVQPKFTN